MGGRVMPSHEHLAEKYLVGGKLSRRIGRYGMKEGHRRVVSGHWQEGPLTRWRRMGRTGKAEPRALGAGG